MALVCETAGTVKAGRHAVALIVLGLLAGAFIAFGALFMTVVLTGARSATDKVMVIVPRIAAFVAAGFEHSIANLYFLPYGLAVKAWRAAVLGRDRPERRGLSGTDAGGALNNIAVATIGNLVGGSLLVGAVYWFVYLRRRA